MPLDHQRGKAHLVSRSVAVDERLTRLIVDEADLDLLDMIPRWRPDPRGYVTRTVTTVDGRRAEYLHRVIGERMVGRILSFREKVDHHDKDPLNNARSNLRPCTNQANGMNSGPRKGRQFKGTFQRPSGRWGAQLVWNGKNLTIGTFDTEEEAARAYDAKAFGLAGEFAYLNFPLP